MHTRKSKIHPHNNHYSNIAKRTNQYDNPTSHHNTTTQQHFRETLTMRRLKHQIPRIANIQPTQHRRRHLTQTRKENPRDSLYIKHAPERRRVRVVLLVQDAEEHHTKVDEVGAEVYQDAEAHVSV